MLQTRPEIHRDRPDLDLHFRVHNAVRKKDRNRHEHMIAFVSALFRVLDIIFDRHDFQIALVSDHLRQSVNIRRKRTDQPHACNVVDIPDHILDRDFVSVAL